MDALRDSLSHWHFSVPSLTVSSADFYRAVTACLEAKGSPVSVEEINLDQGGIFSGRRTYLRISYRQLSFDLCAAPFGQDYFFSWWLVRRRTAGARFLAYCVTGLATLILGLLITNVSLVQAFLMFFVIVLLSLVFAHTLPTGQTVFDVEDIVRELPIIGRALSGLFVRDTYYATDARMAFEESVHAVVLQEVDAIVKAKGLRALAPEEAKPQYAPAIR